MSVPTITVNGNLIKDPENRQTNNGKSMTTFTIAYTRRNFNQQTHQWEDKNTSYLDVTCFDTLATNAHQSLHKGSSVIITGQLEQHHYQNKDGQNRSSWRLLADTIGVSLNRGIVTVTTPQTYPAPQGNYNAQSNFDF